VPPRSIGDINRFERPPSFERIDEFIPSMPNENPIPFVPPSAPILPPVIPQIPRPLPIQLPIAPPSIGGVGGINQPLQPVLQQPQPPQTGGILGPNLEIGPGTGGIGARPDLPKLPRSSLFGGNVPGGGGIDYGPVELGPIERPIPQVPSPLQKMPLPPKRDDFMSIGGPGGGFNDDRVLEQQPFVPPQQPTFTPISERTDIYGAGKDYDPANLPEGYTFDKSQVPGKVRTAVMPQPGFVYAYGPDGDRISVPSGAPGAEAQREQGAARDQAFLDFQKTNPGEPFFGGLTPPPIPTPVPDPVTTPAPVTPPEPVTTIPQDTRGQVDPVLAQQDTREVLSDPLLRALYFGTADQPGFINQLQQATQNVMGAELPSAQFDPNMTQQFYNPYEDRVVQQTIQDVMEYGDKQDIAQRAEDIQRGGLSAFGSRARLTAGERQEALGRGLAEALSGIRSQGYTEAQRRALENYQNQYTRQLGQIDRPVGLLTSIGRSLPGYGAASTTIESDYRMPVDPSTAGLGAALSTYQAIKPPATQTG